MDRGRTCGWELTLESAITTVPLGIYTLKKKSKARGFAQTTSISFLSAQSKSHIFKDSLGDEPIPTKGI